jgi:riboflavin kinase, archaea type
MAESTRLTGIIFSDLGQAMSFMALEWVQASLKQCLGFSPFPATLNVRPKTDADAQVWRRVQSGIRPLALPPVDGGFCSARLYRIEILRPVMLEGRGAVSDGTSIEGAVLLPEVKGYPSDKIEIVAPMRLKDCLDLKDGDPLTLEFLN